MSKIIIYTQDDCPPCNFKNYLTEHINFIEKILSILLIVMKC